MTTSRVYKNLIKPSSTWWLAIAIAGALVLLLLMPRHAFSQTATPASTPPPSSERLREGSFSPSAGNTPTPPEGEDTPAAQEQRAQAYDSFIAQTNNKTLTGGVSGPTDKVGADCNWDEFACHILKFLNRVVDALFAIPFGIIQYLFSWSLETTMTFFAANSPGGFAVNIGFPLVLSVANMFFILILLWIAIATIFDFEPYTARQLLPKLIIAALLINFSLPIGRTIINIGNGIGAIFYRNIQTMGGGSIRGVIAKMFNADGIYLSLVTPNRPNVCAGKSDANCRQAIFEDTRGAGADGQLISAEQCNVNATGASLDQLTLEQIFGKDSLCYNLITSANAQYEVTPKIGQAKEKLLATMLVVKIFIYPIAMFVLFAGAILFIIRSVSLAFVLVLGPMAFLFLVMPQTNQYWGMWWDKLFKWTFFLPVFMFLFWLGAAMIFKVPDSFYTISSGGAAQPSGMALLAVYFMAAAFMIGALTMAQQMGIAGASTVTGWGKKMAGGLGGWAKGKVGRMALRAAAPLAKMLEEKGVAGKEGNILARALTSIPGVRRGLTRVTTAERAQAEEFKKRFGNFSSKELKRRHNMATTSMAERRAIMETLADRRDIAAEDDEKGYWNADKVADAIKYMKSVGADPIGLERAVPHMIKERTEEETQRRLEQVMAGMRSEHISRLDPHALDDPRVLREAAKWKQGLFQTMMSFSPGALGGRFQKALDDDKLGPELEGLMSDATMDYFKRSPVQGFGYRLRGWTARAKEQRGDREGGIITPPGGQGEPTKPRGERQPGDIPQL